jgi:hypothetical protein
MVGFYFRDFGLRKSNGKRESVCVIRVSHWPKQRP